MMRNRPASNFSTHLRNSVQRARVAGLRKFPSPTTRSTARPSECLEVAVKVSPPPRTSSHACRRDER